MVKHEVEIETLGDCIDEIDKLAELIDEMQLKQEDQSCVHASNKLHLHVFHVVAVGRPWRMMFIALMSINQLAKSFQRSYSTYSLSLVTPSSVIEGQTSGPFSTEARIILPCGLFIIYSSIMLFHESYKCFSSIGGLLSLPKEENENLKAQIHENMKYNTMESVKPRVLAPGRYAIDIEPIPPHKRNNREVHLYYLKHLKESVETLREIVEEAKVERPFDRSLASACLYTKHSQELLEYAIDTYPKDFNQRDKRHAPTL
ncbi:hypothetical protein Tco_0454619 [Tanacetum coccineum]